MLSQRIGNAVYHIRRDGPWERADAGLVVAFSNSLGTDLRVWNPVLPFLPPSWRLFRYDTAGHGLSDFPGPMSISDHAADLGGILGAQGISSAVVVGLSVGGLIAQALARMAPELVSALVLCDTAAKIGDDATWNERIAAVDRIGLDEMADAVMERWFSSSFRATRKDDLMLWRTMLARTPGHSYKALCAAIRDADLTADAPSIGVPTLAVTGTEDKATPPDTVRATAALIPGAAFREIDGAGHLPCVEAPENLARHIITFLEENNLG